MLIRMKALRAFSTVLDMQQYHGDPAHPDHENGRKFNVLNEDHAARLEATGDAERIKFVEADDASEPASGEHQEVFGRNGTDVGNATDAAAGVFPSGEETTGTAGPFTAAPLPAGGLDSNATDNHHAGHTLNTGGNARGTPDPDAAPTGADDGGKAAAPRRRNASPTKKASSRRPAARKPAAARPASPAGDQGGGGKPADAAPGA